MGLIVYYSSRSENTHRFLQNWGDDCFACRSAPRKTFLTCRSPMFSSPHLWGRRHERSGTETGYPVLNEPSNRNLIRGVIAAGNTNFGAAFASAGDIVSRKCAVPFLYRFELLGTEEDVANVNHGLERFWTR